MRLDDMPTLRHAINGLQLQKEMMRAINFAQIQHDATSGTTDATDALRDFLNKCVALVPTKTKEKKSA
jgi:hypothetical protein